MKNQSNYSSWPNEAKAEFLKDHYHNQGLSLRKIATNAGVSVSTIKRDCDKLNIGTRSHSDAQKLALASGTPHPTKGKTHSDETKQKIADGMYDAWKNDIDKADRSEKSKEAWKRLDHTKRKEIKHKAAVAIRDASINGSKLERYFLENLSKFGFKASFHHEKTLGGTRLQVDMMIQDMGIAMEINGLSHYSPIWGDKSYNRTKNADNTKRALLLNNGFTLINIKNTKASSNKRFQMLLAELVDLLNKIKSREVTGTFFEIGE